MKKIVLVLILSCSLLSQLFAGENIEYFRLAFNGIKDYSTAETFLNTQIEDSVTSNVTAIFAYKAVCTMMIAQYVNNPFTKLSYFNKGKKMLDISIKTNKNVENIYLRLMVQLNAPSFLGYNEEIEADTKFIELTISEALIPDETKKYILKNLIETGKTDSLRTLAKKYKAV